MDMGIARQAAEHQHRGIRAFLRACAAAAWLEYRNLRFYPSNLLLAAMQELPRWGSGTSSRAF